MVRITGQPSGTPAPAAPYTPSVRIGSLVAVSGQVGMLPESRASVGDDVADQTRQALANVAAALAASGASMDDVIKVNVFLVDAADFQAMNDVYREVFDEPFPARTTVFVGLAKDWKVEIDALAVVAGE